MKKILSLSAIVLVLLSLCACSKGDGEATTTTENESSFSAVSSDDNGLIYYDKNGVAHNSIGELPFYDKNDKPYYYVEELENPYFTDEEGNHYDGLNCFIDSNGDFVIDTEDEIELTDDGMHAKDKEGNIYYSAATVRWDIDGNPISVFGFGEIITQNH